MNRAYQICTRCIMDTTDPEIVFDDQGICNHCHNYKQRVDREIIAPADQQAHLKQLVERIKKDGQGKEYDCIVGVSGGVDSSYLAFIAKEYGLRLLAVHFDNGWNSELAVDNIQKILSKLEIDLHTYVIDWDEFCDLQKSFLKASVPNVEIPTDHAISAILWGTAYQKGIRYILNGSNLKTEGIMPLAWTYTAYDYYHIRAIQRMFGTKPLQSFPKLGFFRFLWYVVFCKIRVINVLNYMNYDKDAAIQLLLERFDWRPYQEKHYESVWTRFYQGYYLVKKFGYDKRRPHLSTLVNSGQLTREDALERMEIKSYPDELFKKDYDFVLKKFGLSDAKFEALLQEPAKSHFSYPNLKNLYLQSSKLQGAFVRIAKVR